MSAAVAVVPISAFEAAEARAPAVGPAAQEVIGILSSRVTAPEYVRTPQFARRARARGGRNAQLEWSGSGDSGAGFKVTVLRKRDGMDGVVDRLRKHINKMSAKTYESLRAKAFAEIEGQEGAGDSLEVSAAVFELVASNAFYSGLYASFYASLLDKYPGMRATLDDRLASAGETLAAAITRDPSDGYDAFCDQNKLNAAKRAVGKFYVSLAARGVVEAARVLSVVREVQSTLSGTPKERSSGDLRNELSETLFEMLAFPESSCLRSEPAWGEVERALREYAAQRPSAAQGLTGKSVFRHMDIIDALRARR